MLSKTSFLLLTVVLGCLSQEGPQVRLADGPDSQSGAVEIFFNGQWGRVCADGFSVFDAEVVCKQASEKSLIGLKNGDYSTTAPFVVSSIVCKGTETAVAQCSITGGTECRSGRSAGVSCGDLSVTGTLGFEAGIVAGIIVASTALIGIAVLSVGCLYRNACCKPSAVA